MRTVKRFIKIVVSEIVLGSVCLGMLNVRPACGQSSRKGSLPAPAKTAPQFFAEDAKPLPASEINQGGITVEWRQGKLSVNSNGAPLSEVLQRVSTQTGIEFLNLDRLHERISVHFSKVSLRVGLQILLAGMDYATSGEPTDPTKMRMVIFGLSMRESAKATTATEPPREIAQTEMKDDPPTELQAEDLDSTTELSVLRQALRSKDPEVKEAAIKALAERGGPEGIDLLRETFRDSDPAVKMIVVENLDSASTPDALALLREASQDSEASVREAALAAISNKE